MRAAAKLVLHSRLLLQGCRLETLLREGCCCESVL
jgi:hypothetical protein